MSTKKEIVGELIAWQCAPAAPRIMKARVEREWMEIANQKFVYRCLPINIANQMGWDIINPITFKAIWNGGTRTEDINISWPSPKTSNIVTSHFGEGILTFTMGHLFQTPEGVNLWVKGPTNWIKDGIQAIEGVVETDWNPATFTMNWKFTRPYFPIYFEAGDPICRIIPIPRYVSEVYTPQIRSLVENEELKTKHHLWREKRDTFNKELRDPHSDAVKQGWQKGYFKGTEGREVRVENHQTRLEQPEFEDLRKETEKQQDIIPISDVRPILMKDSRGKNITVFINILRKEI